MNAYSGKLAIIAAILGILLLGGIYANQTEVQAPVASQLSIEMLGPVYSEKAVYKDDLIHISFKTPLKANGIESALPFWLQNTSGDSFTVLWDRCSIQLPSGNTVNVANKGVRNDMGPVVGDQMISIAPGAYLFDTLIPISEAYSTDEGWVITKDVLDQGPFQFVLALDLAGGLGERRIKYYTFQLIIR